MSRAGHQRGQSLIESVIVLLIFLAMLFGVMDCGQVLFAHQSLVERVNASLRWGTTHSWQGPEPVVNLVLYNQTEEPHDSREAYLGLKPENVAVNYRRATADRPDDELLSVSIVNFEARLFSPWIAHSLVSTRPVLAIAPMAAKASVPGIATR